MQRFDFLDLEERMATQYALDASPTRRKVGFEGFLLIRLARGARLGRRLGGRRGGGRMVALALGGGHLLDREQPLHVLRLLLAGEAVIDAVCGAERLQRLDGEAR